MTDHLNGHGKQLLPRTLQRTVPPGSPWSMSMVSTTSFEGLESMSWAPSEAKPTAFITPGGANNCIPWPNQRFPPDYTLQSWGGTLGPRANLRPARRGLLEVDGPSPSGLSPELPEAEWLGKRHTDAALTMSVPWYPVWEQLVVWGRTMEWMLCNLSRCRQIHHLRMESPFPRPQKPRLLSHE